MYMRIFTKTSGGSARPAQVGLSPRRRGSLSKMASGTPSAEWP